MKNSDYNIHSRNFGFQARRLKSPAASIKLQRIAKS